MNISAIVLCIVTYLVYASYTGMVVIWYYIAATIIATFIVAFIAMYGWEKLTAFWNRFQSTGGDAK